MRGVMGARRAQTGVFDKAHRTNRLVTAIRSQALSVVAIGALLATTLVLSNETHAQASTPACGALSSDGFHEVTNATQLEAVGRSGTGNCQLGAKYRLMNSITLSGNWTPIPFEFTGEFDGGGHGISGLTVVNTTGDAGFFSEIGADAKIKNLRLVNVDVKGGSSAGGLAPFIEGSNIVIRDVFISGTVEGGSSVGGLASFVGGSATTIENVRSEAEVTCGGTCGGLIGQLGGAFNNPGGQVFQSSATGEVTGRQAVGGLVGLLAAGSSISYSFATGNVKGVTAEATVESVGGLVGESQGEIADSYARGSVTASFGQTGNPPVTNRSVGGFVGQGQRAESFPTIISRSYATGVVISSTDDPLPNRGGFAGLAPAGGFGTQISTSFPKSVWDEDTTGLTTSAAVTGAEVVPPSGFTTAQMTSFDTFGPSGLGWEIVEGWESFDAPNKVWGICPAVNDGYPFLLWEYDADPCGGSESPAVGTSPNRERQASAPAIHLDLQANVGDRVSGAPVVVGGEGLLAGSTMTLVVRSTPQTLVSGRVSSLGNFSTRASLPALSPGSHTLTLTGTAPDGAVLTLVQGFVVGADGTFTSIGQPAGSQTGGLAATGVPANAGVLFAVSSLMLLAIGLSLLRARSRQQFTE